MAEETLTRIEKMIPDYHKLNFRNKEETRVETELEGLDDNAVLVWRQLESQAHMANEQLEKALDIFNEWLNDYEEVRDMIITQRALGVISNFGKLLLALDTEKQFLLINKRVKVEEFVAREPVGQEINEKFYKRKIALLLCGELGFDTGGKGRGKLGTYQKVGNVLEVEKKTIESWIDNMIESKYIEKLVKNFQELLDRRETRVENIGDLIKTSEKIKQMNKNSLEKPKDAPLTPKSVDKINKNANGGVDNREFFG